MTGRGMDAGPAETPEATEATEAHASAALGRSFLQTFVTSGLTIVLTAFAGVLGARVLGASGRGEFSAVSSWMLTMSWLSALGFGEAMTFYQARHPEQGRQILSTTLTSILLLGGLGIVLTEVLLPYGFAAQSAETLRVARLFALSLPALVGFNSLCALLSGHQRFRVLNMARLGQPLIYAVLLTLLWTRGSFSVIEALLAMVISYVAVVVGSAGYLIAVVGLGRPSRELARRGLGYGLRLQGQTLGAVGNTRLDVTLLPGFVAALPLGYYAIAVSVASMAAVLFGQLSFVLFPAASRAGGQHGPALVERTLRVVMVAATAMVIVVGVISPWMIPFVYGEAFRGSVGPLLILLPGIVLWSGATILAAGLQAANRPGMASIAQLIGLAVTVTGLVITLPRIGIYGAAWTSTVAYTVTFVVAMIFLNREQGFSIARVSSPRLFLGDVSSAWRHVGRGRLTGESAAPAASE